MVQKYSDQSIVGIINNLNYGINKESGEIKKIIEPQDAFVINNKYEDKMYSDSEKNAMLEMYAEIITFIVNQHFE